MSGSLWDTPVGEMPPELKAKLDEVAAHLKNHPPDPELIRKAIERADKRVEAFRARPQPICNCLHCIVLD